MLADRNIELYLATDLLDIKPLDKDQIEPASVDLRLGNSFAKQKNKEDSKFITLDEEVEYEEWNNMDSYIIEPHEFVLATTKETIALRRNLIGFIQGRSSIGRLGLFVENAGFIDTNFQGQITLELYNAGNMPIKLEKDRRICQLVIGETKSPSKRKYDGKYQGQIGATGSKINLDREVLR